METAGNNVTFGRPGFDLRVPVTTATNFCEDVLIVHVGTPGSATVFVVYKQHACSNSKFFKAAMSHGFKESQTRVVELPEDSPDSFRVWLNWIMSHTIMSSLPDATCSNVEHEAEYVHLVNAYILGEKLDDAGFQDAVMDAMVAKTQTTVNHMFHCPGSTTINLIWEKTLPDSRLRHFVLDQYSLFGQPEWLIEDCDGGEEVFDSGFLLDFAMKLMTVRDVYRLIREAVDLSTCKYHRHSEVDGSCYKSGL